MKKARMTIIRDGAIYIAASVCLLAGIAGIRVWPKNQQPVGYFTVSANPWGVAFFQPGVHTTIQWNGYTIYSRTGNTITLKPTSAASPSIDFGRDDIIYDDEGNLYTESKEREIQTVSELTGIPLKKLQVSDKSIITGSTRFYIINPHVPGMLELEFAEKSMTTIDRETKKMINISSAQATVSIRDRIQKAGAI